LQRQVAKSLKAFFERESRILAAYLFGSYVRGNAIAKSDIDVAVLLSEIPGRILEFYLHLINEISQVFAGDVDLVILNTAPPTLKHQAIKFGNLVYCRDEKSRIEFEARAEDEYLDFSRLLARYNECLWKQVLA